MPVFFIRGEPIKTIRVPRPFTLVIADTGVPSPTAAAVLDVRSNWEADPVKYERIFDAIQDLVHKGRDAIRRGNPEAVGGLMDENHAQLQEMGVSSVELDQLVNAARAAGALGAKLSGGGRGGNVIALVHQGQTSRVESALQEAGATCTIVTKVSDPN
jgi:mevalonate kinase